MRCVLFFSLLFPLFVFSAGPVFHLWAAVRFCSVFDITDEETVREILIGTEFPDIRYLAHLPRDLTHPQISSINEVLSSDTAFECGMKLHAWLDGVREDFVVQEGLYETVAPIAPGPSGVAFLKLLEEEIFGDFFDGCDYMHHFRTVLLEETALVGQDVVKQWHEYIQWSFVFRPSSYLWGKSFLGPAFGIPADTIYKWSYVLPQLKEEYVFRRYFYALCDHIEEQMRRADNNYVIRGAFFK